MGTISEKLTYLNDTRLKIKDSLNKFGADLTENDTFRSYSNVLNDIYDKLPKVSGNGSNFTLENAQNGKLDLFEMEGNTEQDSYSGANILLQNEYISSQTINGITYTNNGDGTFNLSGTATANTALRIIDVGVFNLESGQAYYLYSSVPYNNNTFNMSIITVENGTNKYFIANTTYTPSTTPTNSRLQFYVASGNTVNVQNVKLMLVKGSTAPTDYEPYVGGKASPNPDYPQDVKVVENKQVVNVHGKNLFDIDTIIPVSIGSRSYVTYDNINKSVTITNNSADSYFPSLYGTQSYINGINIPIKKNTDYTFSVEADKSNLKCGVYGYNNSENHYTLLTSWLTSSGSVSFNSGNYEEITIRFGSTSPAGTKTTFNKIQLEEGSSATSYEPYHNQDYEIDLHGKNLFDLQEYPFVKKVAYNASGNQVTWTNYSGIKEYFPVKENTTYSFSNNINYDIYYGLVYYDEQKNIISNVVSHTTTFTTPVNCKYIRFSIHTEKLPTWVQLEQDSTVTDYEEFYDYKPCKIGDYKDVIFKNNQLSEYYDNTLDEDGWYIKKNIGKVVLDGSETYGSFSNNRYRTSIPISGRDAFTNKICLCNILKGATQSELGTTQIENGIAINTIYAWIRITNTTTLEELQTLLSNNNAIVYYVLATPTYEKITNETLISQLEAIETETGTNIFEVSNDNDVLPSLNVKRLKELEKLS